MTKDVYDDHGNLERISIPMSLVEWLDEHEDEIVARGIAGLKGERP